MYIYKITNKVNNKIYVGQTVRDPKVRFLEHMNDSVSQDYFHQAIRKYGPDNFTFEIIDEAQTIDELNQKEIFWIKELNSYACSSSNGYNTTHGGQDNPMSHENVKEKHDKIMRSDEVRKKISDTMKQKVSRGELFDEKHRKSLSESMKGNQHFKGHKRTPEAIQATSKALHKKVYCVDETGALVKSFDAVVDAAEWWYHNGYKQNRKISDYRRLLDVIKDSSKKDRYILGLKWIYE